MSSVLWEMWYDSQCLDWYSVCTVKVSQYIVVYFGGVYLLIPLYPSPFHPSTYINDKLNFLLKKWKATNIKICSQNFTQNF